MQRLQSALLNTLARLPLGTLHALALAGSFVADRILHWRRKLITANLERAFPERSAAQRVQIRRDHYQVLFDTALETLKARNLPREDLLERVSFVNMDVLEQLEGQPFLLVGGHQGNWEWQMLALSATSNIPLEAVFAPLPTPATEAYLTAARTRFGMTLIPQEHTLRELGRRLRQPRAVIMLADQNPRRDAERYWISFLGQDTAFGTGLDKVARLTRYPVVFFHGVRIARGCYQVHFELLTEPPYDKQGDAVTNAYAAALERTIQAHPEDWLWSYDRWRHPKSLYD